MAPASGILRRALVDLDAFAANLDPSAEWDARADAYGHALDLLAPVALARGVTRVVASEMSPALAPFAQRRVARSMEPPTDAALRAYGVDGTTRPVLALVGEVVAVKRVPAGVPVSYGYTYRTDAPATLALVALGYADGIPRLASNRATALVGGEIGPVAGRIAMDQFVVDCGDRSVDRGRAILFGDPARGEPSLLDWAIATERTPLQLTAGLGHRIERVAR